MSGRDKVDANLLLRHERGVPTSDRAGLEFDTITDAIEHSKELARRLRGDPRLSIVVIDASGTEIHREPVIRARDLVAKICKPVRDHILRRRNRLRMRRNDRDRQR